MKSRIRFRPSLAQTRRLNQQALDFYRLTSARDDAVRVDVGAKPKRAAPVRAEPAAPVGLEADVLRAVSQILQRHPAVLLALRMNSGAAVDDSGRPIWFHKLLKGRGVVTDFVGLLRTDSSIVPFAIECKRPGWVPGKSSGATRIREDAQSWFIEDVVKHGGRGGFVTSVEQALAVLEGR